MPNIPINSDDNCETEGVIGTLAGIVGSIQANEVVKEIISIGDTLCGYILIIDALKLTFRKVKLNKRSDCFCNEKKLKKLFYCLCFFFVSFIFNLKIYCK